MLKSSLCHYVVMPTYFPKELTVADTSAAAAANIAN